MGDNNTKRTTTEEEAIIANSTTRERYNLAVEYGASEDDMMKHGYPLMLASSGHSYQSQNQHRAFRIIDSTSVLMSYMILYSVLIASDDSELSYPAYLNYDTVVERRTRVDMIVFCMFYLIFLAIGIFDVLKMFRILLVFASMATYSATVIFDPMNLLNPPIALGVLCLFPHLAIVYDGIQQAARSSQYHLR